MKFKRMVEVETKRRKKIMVLECEISGLKKAGVLDSKVKEEKVPAQTKEDKTATSTKEANEKMAPSKKRPVNISSKSVN